MGFGNANVWVLFVTTVLSHLSMLPVTYQLMRRRWLLETCVCLYGLTVSTLYHLAQSFHTKKLFLSELQWHRLDNIGALSYFGVHCIYFANVASPFWDQALKLFVIFFSVVIQEKSPWDERYTFGPVLAYLLIPFVYYGLIARKLPQYHFKKFFGALGIFLVAFYFFIIGLNDDNDPERVFHGLWHVIGGFASYHLWSVVKNPVIVPLPLKVQDGNRSGPAIEGKSAVP